MSRNRGDRVCKAKTNFGGQTIVTDQYHHWRLALQGTPVESEIGAPRAGFWKAPQDEPVAFWYDTDGIVHCERTRFGGGDRMPHDKIDELFSSASRYPLTEETYYAARDGNPPVGFNTRLTLKEIASNVVWSIELGARKTGAAAAPVAEAPVQVETVAADPTPGHTHDGEQTPDMVLLVEVSALGAGVKVWLAGIGGKPRNKAEADQLADYATKFGTLSKKAETARVTEKQPYLDAGREIDAKWSRPKSNADGSRKRCLDIAQEWRVAEDRRREAEAAAANAEAAAAAERASKQYDAPVTPPAPVQSEKVGGLGNVRTVAERSRTVWQVDDPREYLRHLLSSNSEELPAEIIGALGKVASRRAVEAPGVSKQTVKVAA